MRAFSIIGLSLLLVYLVYNAATYGSTTQNILVQKDVSAITATKALPTKPPAKQRQEYSVITEEFIIVETIEEVEE